MSVVIRSRSSRCATSHRASSRSPFIGRAADVAGRRGPRARSASDGPRSLARIGLMYQGAIRARPAAALVAIGGGAAVARFRQARGHRLRVAALVVTALCAGAERSFFGKWEGSGGRFPITHNRPKPRGLAPVPVEASAARQAGGFKRDGFRQAEGQGKEGGGQWLTGPADRGLCPPQGWGGQFRDAGSGASVGNAA